jgi:hypothetical protein
MLIDYLVSALQVMAFGFIAYGCVLCLWAVVLDARLADIEHRRDPADRDRRPSPHWLEEQGNPVATFHG